MNIVFLTTAHNSLSQRAFVELVDRGHTVVVVIASCEYDGLRFHVNRTIYRSKHIRKTGTPIGTKSGQSLMTAGRLLSYTSYIRPVPERTSFPH